MINYGYLEDAIPTSYPQFSWWVEQKNHGPLEYLTGERGWQRGDLRRYYPAFQSALVFIFDYSSVRAELEKIYGEHRLASYVFACEGKDYHHYYRRILETRAKEIIGDRSIEFKLGLDTAPLLERDMAFKAGLGWFGKNSMLINRDQGSFLFIGSILFSEVLPEFQHLLKKRAVESDHCGTCTRCIDACPTNAIDPETRTLIANQCISTFTIEQFKASAAVPVGMEKGKGELFGCEICQDVCPWNGKIWDNTNGEFLEKGKNPFLIKFFLQRSLDKIMADTSAMSARAYRKFFAGTPLSRTGKEGMLKNLKQALRANKLN